MGCVMKLHGEAVHWYSRKIKSTTEAEYIGLAEAGKEAIWIRRLLANVQQREEEQKGLYLSMGTIKRLCTSQRQGQDPRQSIYL